MIQNKKEIPKEKSQLHPRNKHRERYNFKELIQSCPELGPFVKLNPYQEESINFSDPKAVLMLNKALLKFFYGIDHWNIPTGFLCPPIPGRADYIHYVADLLANSHTGKIPKGNKIKCLDIGVGANCIYPIVGIKEYGWSFVGSDVDPKSIQSANNIIQTNRLLKGNVRVRLQQNSNDIFKGIIQNEEFFDVTICNPPFHSSFEEAQAGTIRKVSNLRQKKELNPTLNFGGQNNELWCTGGELQFVQNMIHQSKLFANSCCWFTTIISKQSNLKHIYRFLEQIEAIQIKTIPMSQGDKISRIVAWSFLSSKQQELWFQKRNNF
ncbi:MAG: 23S rRNA (adenine(1618)-N(6))-methyltransferase RlmF [Bacteroidetes bacterium HGW-Bacteroidetes-19]|nr:MAG: 23S rRNA (adenine(1618)-N(6))-methyltransferase RlmF [Bacteroidetes bacterium HGW-Bacteroidetes-20]PKP27513.1 MAG: 23S rRNA (adenine(1618)-N(6))-methyltransferase RlmF [Bacteroidetes bacterium HGW-Bacteroidetes-19]